MGLILLVVHWALLAFLALLTARAVLALGPLLVRDWEPKEAVKCDEKFRALAEQAPHGKQVIDLVGFMSKATSAGSRTEGICW